jgi:hypothetical protein
LPDGSEEPIGHGPHPLIPVLRDAGPLGGDAALSRAPVGRFLLERTRALADSRGSKMLYVRVAPQHADYFEEQGWRRLDGKPGAGSSLALVWPIGPDDTQNDLNTTDAVELWARYGRAGAAAAPPVLA